MIRVGHEPPFISAAVNQDGKKKPQIVKFQLMHFYSLIYLFIYLLTYFLQGSGGALISLRIMKQVFKYLKIYPEVSFPQ